MSLTIREQVLAAVATRLAALSGVNFKRNDDSAVKLSDMPAVRLVDGGMDVVRDNQYFDVRYQRFYIECHVTAKTSDDLGPALSDLTGKAEIAILADVTLGGLSINIDTQADFLSDPVIDRDEGSAPAAATSLGFVVQFQTKANDPYTIS